jgi:hypothetical protein
LTLVGQANVSNAGITNKLVKRRKIRTRIIGLLLIPLLVAVGEVLARFTVPDYVIFRYVSPNDVYLHEANRYEELDEHGLYANAETVMFRTSPNRFIEPEPELSPILFLGGSTTEALHVPESKRWPALLGGYNGARSGANILDELRVFNYLTQKGYRFCWLC